MNHLYGLIVRAVKDRDRIFKWSGSLKPDTKNSFKILFLGSLLFFNYKSEGKTNNCDFLADKYYIFVRQIMVRLFVHK